MAEIREVLDVLQTLAPLSLAAEWDNVGLLVEGEREVHRIALCIDLTEHVLAEVIAHDPDLIMAYHPPIFKGLLRLADTPSGRIITRTIRAGLHLYTPHTALDAAAGGMTDWLVRAPGEIYNVAPILPHPNHPDAGHGRTATLRAPCSLAELLTPIKAHLGISMLRVASPGDVGLIHTIAACPGAGSDIVSRAKHVDLVLTGEMRHHDILACLARGTTVVLTDHTHSERGFLPILAKKLSGMLPGVSTWCAHLDREPLSIR